MRMRLAMSAGASSWLPSRLLQAGLERGDVRPEQARLNVLEQVLHHQQGVDFRGIEPEAGQLELRRVSCRRREVVAAGVAIEDDGRVHPVAQVLEIALDRRAGNAERFLDLLEGGEPVFVQQLLDLVEALGTVHVDLADAARVNMPPGTAMVGSAIAVLPAG